MTSAPTVELRPACDEWIASLRNASPDGARCRVRAELGLPTDRPVAMSGHQIEFWHPGILAKYYALQRAAALAGAAVSWLELDTDASESWRVPYPAPGPVRAVWSLRPPAPGVAVMHLPPAMIVPGVVLTLDPPPGADFVREGLEAIARCLGRHAGAPSLARQIALARTDLLPEGVLPVPALFSSALSSTSIFAEAVERMATDARACAETFNHAAAMFPRARVRPLAIAPRVELPLWVIEPGRPRRRVFADEVRSLPMPLLAPRAIFLTTLLRAFACDLFIHGLGGERYDRVSEVWASRWWGWSLAPAPIATATLRLPLLVDPLPDPAEIDRARWLAWHARTEPALLGDEAAAREKIAILQRIRRARSRKERAECFAHLRRVVAAARERSARRLQELESRSAALRAHRARAAVAYDRTWPFPLYPRARLAELRASIDRQFGTDS